MMDANIFGNIENITESPSSDYSLKSSSSAYNTPKKPRYADRFIPSRAGNRWHLTPGPLITSTPNPPKKNDSTGSNSSSQSRNQVKTPDTNNKSKDQSDYASTYSCLLKNELLGYTEADYAEMTPQKMKPCRRLFHYDTADRPSLANDNNDMMGSFSTSSLSSASRKVLHCASKKQIRRIPKDAYKVLDAPELQDDFYLNLLDWSSQNVISIGLGSCVYLWSASTTHVTKLCDLGPGNYNVSSVKWNERGNLLSVGTRAGPVQIWDVQTEKLLTTLRGHTARVGVSAWSGNLITSGSRDKTILQNDIRTNPAMQERILNGHMHEVCGMQWSPQNQYLASGGNDNVLNIWNMHSPKPIQVFDKHVAAIKAIAWSPHHHGLLASGGGSADKTIKFWNTLTGQLVKSVDTGVQVCNLAWSKYSPEFVSTHGYSQNHVILWKYPSLQQLAKLKGHSSRVLYLSISPDGENIVTGAGDETLRFWNLFKKQDHALETKSTLNLYNCLR